MLYHRVNGTEACKPLFTVFFSGACFWWPTPPLKPINRHLRTSAMSTPMPTPHGHCFHTAVVFVVVFLGRPFALFPACLPFWLRCGLTACISGTSGMKAGLGTGSGGWRGCPFQSLLCLANSARYAWRFWLYRAKS